MFDYSMHTHTRSREAKAQELGRLQNTTHEPIHLQNIQNPYKSGCIGPFDFVVVQLSLYGHSLGSWGRAIHNIWFLSTQFTSYQERDGRALSLVWLPFIKRSVSQGPRGCVLQQTRENDALPAASFSFGEEAK